MSVVEEIINQWEQDAKISEDDIANNALKTSILHAKYLRILASWKQKHTNLKVKLNECRQLKTRYYNGELSVEQCKTLLNLPQYQGNRPVKSQLDALLSADEDVNKILIQVEAVETIVYVVDSILMQIKSRDFEISNYIKMRMFEAGR